MTDLQFTTTLDMAGDTYGLSVAEGKAITTDIGTAVVVNWVQGQFQDKSVTPSNTVQTIQPDPGYDGLTQVVVAAIPSNYGLITWNGATLTVS